MSIEIMAAEPAVDVPVNCLLTHSGLASDCEIAKAICNRKLLGIGSCRHVGFGETIDKTVRFRAEFDSICLPRITTCEHSCGQNNRRQLRIKAEASLDHGRRGPRFVTALINCFGAKGISLSGAGVRSAGDYHMMSFVLRSPPPGKFAALTGQSVLEVSWEPRTYVRMQCLEVLFYVGEHEFDLREVSQYIPKAKMILSLPPAACSTLGSEVAPRVQPRDVIDRFLILKEIGDGGFGVVFEAMDLSLGVKRAIKLCGTGIGHSEARRAAMLRHPNICHVYEIGSHGNQDYIVMELIEGVTLRTLLQNEKRKPLTKKKLFELVLQIAEALECAHQAGVTHGDVKPENIILDSGSHVKLLDFGLGRTTKFARDEVLIEDERRFAETDSLLGTIGYMAPELLDGQPISPASDIFSFGLVVYELVTGRTALRFDSSTVHEIHSVLREFNVADVLDEGEDVRVWRELLVATLAIESEQRWSIDEILVWLRKHVRKRSKVQSRKSADEN